LPYLKISFAEALIFSTFASRFGGRVKVEKMAEEIRRAGFILK
jgi:hypothetical protein